MKFIYFSFLSILLTSCWPKSISFRDGSMPPEWKTFAVKTLELSAPNAPISYAPNLSEKIKDGIQNNTKFIINKPTICKAVGLHKTSEKELIKLAKL